MEPKSNRLKSETHILGYSVKRVVELEDLNSIFYFLIHEKTGAQHIHIANDDTENTFSVAFKTISLNSTGIAHILEHIVLCGSNSFPVRDPFFSMLKRSLSTFMNAFTSPDWTMYVFSTQNNKDFYNLMSVYLDSVFFPNISELSFKQEGCRLDFDDIFLKKNFVYKGVVYNEMKGVMSSPDQVMARSLSNALYPDTIYSNNSGGDPVEIPILTYDELKLFHNKYYHPSNSFFYTYGDIQLEEHLKFIDEKFLNNFSYSKSLPYIPSQLRWKEQKEVTYYDFLKNDDYEKKCQVCVAWLMCDIKDTFNILVLSVIEEVLLGDSASPLKKALMDSQLGNAISDCTGFDCEKRDTMFSCGLKDVKESKAKEVENIIFNELNKIVVNGIDKLLLDSVFHQIELNKKEKTSTPYPFGLKLILEIIPSWIHGGKHERILQIDNELNKFKNCLKRDTKFLEKKIKYYFINNKHRVFFILKPDNNIENEKKKLIDGKLINIRRSISKDDLKKIEIDNILLKKMQNSVENLSCLPTLEFEDIPKFIHKDPAPVVISKSHKILNYYEFTSGIIYFSSLIGIGGLNIDDLSLIPFFCYVFSKIGTFSSSYVEMSKNIKLHTGGINLIPYASTKYAKNEECSPVIIFNSKCLSCNREYMIKIIEELVNEVNFENYDRIKQLLFEYKSLIKSMIVKNGHHLAISLASRNFLKSTYINNVWSGVYQLRFLNILFDKIKSKGVVVVSDKLRFIAKTIFSKQNFKIALIGSADDLYKVSDYTERFVKNIKFNGLNGFVSPEFEMKKKYSYEGWITTTSVSFVAQTLKTVKIDHVDSPGLYVISKFIQSMYLHKEIRENGGAYAGFSVYDPGEGLLSFCSYRDPHIVSTINIYGGVRDFVCSLDFTNEDVKEAVLQICSTIDKPYSSFERAKKSFLRRELGLTNRDRQIYKTNLLSLNKKKIKYIIDKYFTEECKNKSIAVISNKQSLDIANDKLVSKKLTMFSI